MRIVLIGQAAFGARTLEALLERGDEVVVIYTSAIPERAQPLKELGEKKNIPVFQPEQLHESSVYENLSRLAPELGVMAFVTDIVPARILQCPKLGTIQYHPSLLPRHRGASAINWAIIQGESKTGLTIFWPDKGIDTGPILLKKEVDISPDATVGSVYFNKLFPLGIEALIEAVQLVQDGRAPRIPQDNSLATYEPPCEEKHAVIDWQRPVSEVYNLIRGTNPQPGATTFWKGKKVKVYDSERLELDVRVKSGEIIEVSDKGFVVAAGGGAILVKRVQPEGSSKISAADFAKEASCTPGDLLI